jgi:hypothetical protein
MSVTCCKYVFHFLFIGKSLPTRNLNDDLNDFLALVPVDKVLGIVLDYLANDQEVQDLIVYLQSDDFHKIVRTIEDLEEFKEVSIQMHVFDKPVCSAAKYCVQI